MSSISYNNFAVIVGLGPLKRSCLGAGMAKVIGKDELLEITFQMEETLWTNGRKRELGNHIFGLLLGMGSAFLLLGPFG